MCRILIGMVICWAIGSMIGLAIGTLIIKVIHYFEDRYYYRF